MYLFVSSHLSVLAQCMRSVNSRRSCADLMTIVRVIGRHYYSSRHNYLLCRFVSCVVHVSIY